jgi:hypothetical protein
MQFMYYANNLLLILEYSYTAYTDAQEIKIHLSQITSIFILLIILRKIFTVRKIKIPNRFIAVSSGLLHASHHFLDFTAQKFCKKLRRHEFDPRIHSIHEQKHKMAATKHVKGSA